MFSTKNYGLLSAFIAAMLFSSVQAQNDSAEAASAPEVQATDDSEKGRFELPDGLVVRPHAYGHFQAGQIVNGSLRNNILDITGDLSNYKIDHVWTEDAVIWAGFDAFYRRNFKIALELGAKLYFSYPQEGTTNRYTKNNRQDVFLEKAYSQYKFGSELEPQTIMQVGYFDFKYNPDVRNLGEYLFRTGTYPVYFDMGFDYPQARLLGLHLKDDVLRNIAGVFGMTNENMENLNLDLFFVSATVFPTMNWSLALLGSYDIANLHFIEIGAGIDWSHLFDVYTGHSFPVRLGGDPTEPHGTLNDAYVDANGDTAYYTFKGTKVMARLNIDPKAFIKSSFFGENDLKVYAEADIIGVKSYPEMAVLVGGLPQTDSLGNPIKKKTAPSYDKWWEKMPVMIGLNVPTFKILDVLNCEVEWFGAQYYNDASGVLNQGSKPLPWDVLINDPSRKMPTKSQLKWSLYAKKSLFGGHFALVGQVGRDHMRLQTAAYDNEMYSELLIEPKDWWWVLKTCWMF
jgi:hypothetical protein